MVSIQALFLALAVSNSGGETVLLDFYGDHCPPCRQMMPAVDRLAQQGYPVRKVNVQQDRALAARFGVSSIPCFVMLVNGQEVDRVVGATSLPRLEQMLQKANVPSRNDIARARGQSPDQLASALPPTGYGEDPFAQSRGSQPVYDPQPPRESYPQPAALSGAEERRLSDLFVAASVRIKVNDKSGHSYGTGTIIDSRGGDALILTCGHLFRDSKGEGPISVELFASGQPQSMPAQLITYDLEADLALLRIRPGQTVPFVKLAPSGQQLSPGTPVVSIGCNHGQDPTARFSRVTTVDRYAGVRNVEVAGRPVVGRSGGGLFSHDGRVVGVCFAANPTEDEGLYVSHIAVHDLLDKQGLAAVVNSAPEAALAGEPRRLDPPRMPAEMPRFDGGSNGAAPIRFTSNEAAGNPGYNRPAAGAANLTPGEAALLEEIRSRGSADVICIIRGPNDKGEVFQLDQASPAFLEQLAAARRAAGGAPANVFPGPGGAPAQDPFGRGR